MDRGTEIVFGYEVTGGDYLYLLQQGGGSLSVLYPPSGLAWLNADAGKGKITPMDPSARPEDEALPAWNPEHSGELTFILVAAPAPRDVAPDAQTTSVATFLKPPPYVTGPAAGLAVELDRVTVTFADGDPAPPGDSPAPPP
ncbi:MAG: hypothetical protein GY898_26470 [Proteobacteria bacterium]|nr:hypothetical protein [Pseudomonadota bacterium]